MGKAWQEKHPQVRFYAESPEWLEELKEEAAAASLGVGDYVKRVLEDRHLVQGRRAEVSAAPKLVECCHCHQQLPDYYIDDFRAKRDAIPQPEELAPTEPTQDPVAPPWVQQPGTPFNSGVERRDPSMESLTEEVLEQARQSAGMVSPGEVAAAVGVLPTTEGQAKED